mgnify:CR=1 FL=1
MCFGSNSTTARADRCQLGEYVTIVDFEAPDAGQPTEVLVQEYDMTQGFDGWTMKSSKGTLTLGPSNLGTVTYACGTTNILGGYSICGSACDLSRTFTGLDDHNFVQLDIEMYWLDNWGNEWLYVYADGARVFAQAKHTSYPASSSSLSAVANMCGASNSDDRGTLRISFYHSRDTLNIQITSNLNAAPSGESWGVASIKVTVGQQGAFNNADITFMRLGTSSHQIRCRMSLQIILCWRQATAAQPRLALSTDEPQMAAARASVCYSRDTSCRTTGSVPATPLS